MNKVDIYKYYKDKITNILRELQEIDEHVTRDFVRINEDPKKHHFRDDLANELIKINIAEIRVLIELVKKRIQFLENNF